MPFRASLLASMSVVAFTSAVSAGPQGGTVVNGAAVITSPNPQSLTVTQSTQNAIINWQSFSLAPSESASFSTPAGGATLNRVTGADPSALYGSLTSNGRLFLINPNGIVVGPTGVIDTAGLVLSTHSVKDAEFLAGRDMTFSGASAASVVNQGTIRATGGGDVFLIARHVENAGSISAPGGAVGLAGGAEVLVRSTDTGDGRIAVRMGPGSVRNAGDIAAVTAELRAAGGNHYALAVNNTGVVRATGVQNRGGRVYLTANAGAVSSSGRVVARNADGSGGKVRIATATRPASAPARRAAPLQNAIDISGSVDVASDTGAGGSVVIEAEAIKLGATARIDASGATGGGVIAIGGGFQGKDATILNADDVTVASGAQIVADAKEKGNGGRISIWSDGSTTFHGAISARGGEKGGNGGFAEVSGKETLIMTGRADLRAPLGAFGTLLLDPGSITIQDGVGAAVDANTFNDAFIEAQLGLGSLTIATSGATNGGAENITVKSGVSIVWNGATLLSLRAGNDIVVQNNVVISNTQTGDGVNTRVQKDVGGVELLAGRNIQIGTVNGAGAIRIGSEFGVTRLVAGDANFNARPDSAGVGKVSIIGGADNAGVQIGYRQTAARGNNTGADYAAPSVHAENGTIQVFAGGDVTLLGGSGEGSFAQIGHGGLTVGDTAAILRSDIHVVSTGGSVSLDTQGVESAFAKIGHGSYFASNGSVALGQISGDIFVDALKSVTLNGAVSPAERVAENGVSDVFLTRIGHGSHAVLSGAGTLVTGDIAGAITVGFREGAVVRPATRLEKVQLGSAISPGKEDDGREVFSQIGHGTQTRLLSINTLGGAFSVTTGAVRSYADINGNLTTRPDIAIRADEILLNSILASPLNGFANIQRASIGNGNYARLQAGELINLAKIDASVTVTGVDPLVDDKTLAQALAVDLSSLSPETRAEVRAKLDALIVANTTLEAYSTAATTTQQSSVVLTEGDLSGNVLVSTNAGTGKGVTLSSIITAGDVWVVDNFALSRIGHGGFIQLDTANGANGAPATQGPPALAPVLGASATQGSPAVAPVRGGDITFTEANVLYSTIRVETNNNDDVTANVSATAGLGPVLGNLLGAAIGSGNEAFLVTGSGGAGVGVNGLSASSGARGGDILYRRGTVWDGAYPTAATTTGDDGYDTTITIASQNNIKFATSATAGLAETAENALLARIGHGAVIALVTGDGGAGGTGANGGRGGDVRMVQQTPGRDYGITGAADDLAWGLRGQITLQANDITGTPALELTSSAAAGLAPARSNTLSSRLGHGDQIFAWTGNGGAGGSRVNDTFVTTAHGGRGGHIDIDLSRRLIESSIVATVVGEIKLDASTTNALTPSTKNISEVAIGHGDSIQAVSGDGGAGGDGKFLTNGDTVSRSQSTAEAFFAFDVFGDESGSGAARGGNGGDISIKLGAITERNGAVGGFVHDGDANIQLTITGANPNKRSLTVNSSIAPGVANGPGDQVTANIGHNTRILALSGSGAAGGAGRASFDAGLLASEPLDATTPVPIQNDASGGRGGDVRIVTGAHDASGAPIGSTGAPAGSFVIGRILIDADEQVAVTSTAGPGTESRAHSGIGHLADIVALTNKGGSGGWLRGTSGTDAKSGANDGIEDSSEDIQVIVNRDGSRGVSLAKNGVADTIQSVAARRTAVPLNNSKANPSFFDVNGNPEFILDASGNLVANTGDNAALRSAPNNVARFGRTVGTYNAGVEMDRVQYVDINNDGRPDVVAAVPGRAAAITLIDADNNNVYDRIAGRTRLPNGDLTALALLDYVPATGRTASVTGNKLNWTYADFSTANGGRGGDARIATGLTRTSVASTPIIALNAGKANTGAPASNADFSLVVSSTMQATPLSAGPNNVASARIGVTDYLYAATDASYNAKLAGILHAGAQGGANGGGAGINAVNGNGGRGGDATVISGGVAGDIAINSDAPKTRGVKINAFTDDVTSGNRSIAAIGHGGQHFATAANTGGAGASDSGNGSMITESANGGRGGNALIQIAEVKGAITVRAGSAEAGGDFAIVIEAIKGGATAIGDDDDITFANIGHGGLLDATGGAGGSADDGQYQANGGAGGSATIVTAAVSGDITLDSFTYADAAFGNGVRIEASTSEGGTQKVRAQAGHYAWANGNGGFGGAGTAQSEITEQFNQQANGGAGGLASIKLAGFAGAIVIDAGPAKSGDDAIVIKSSDNTVNSKANNYLLAAAGHGARGNALGGAGGRSGQRDAKGGLTLAADPAFHEGFDIPGAAGSTAPKDRNPIMFGTVRDGGDGGDAAVEIGETSGAVTLTAHDLSGGGKDGIFISSLVGDGANTGSSLFGNLAIVGHNHNASATGGAGGSSISGTLGATVTSGDGGDGGAGAVRFGVVSGDITLTNVVAGEANKTGGALDKNIRILASDQDATDSADHRATARVGHRTMADAFGGAGGNAALPPPGPLYSATLSAQGGFGGAATITSAAVTGNISITAENSVLIEALNPTVSSPTVVAGVGHHAIANAAIAGAGGFGGVSGSFNDAAVLTALRRFVDLGQDFSNLSDLEKELVAPVLRYYKLAAVYDGSAGPAASRLPAGFVSRILAGPAAFVAGTPNAYPLARDNDAIGGTDNSVPKVSDNEKNTLIALSMASGHGGGAYVTQAAITGDISLGANSANASDAARGILVSTLGVLNSGTQIAHIGHESEVAQATGGKGQNVRAGTIAEGIGGDGGEVRIVQQLVSGAISLTAGSSLLSTYGDIVVKASGTQTSGWQRSLIGHRATVGSDDPGFRTQPVARAGDGGGDQDALANGKLGNGGAVSIEQAGAAGAITLTSRSEKVGADSISVLSAANLAMGETLASIGHALVIDSVKAGDAIPYTVGPDARASLYGVREGNGGSVSITQGPISDAITLDADGKLLIESQTALAPGRATTVIGHKQIVADTVYGTRAGFVTAGNGADVKDVEDIDVANGAPGYVNAIHANHVQDADGGNVSINVGAVTANITLQSRRGDVDVLAKGNTGETATAVGHERFVTALTGEGGVTGGPSGPRSPGEGGGAAITRGAVSGDILVQALAAKTVTVKTTSALGANASVLVGHTADYNITTGRSGYGAAAFAALDKALADFLALPASGAGQATTRDTAVVIHDLENVVAALTIANRYAEHYSAAQRTSLSKALADATKALADARAATTIAGVQAAVTAAKTALALGNTTVIAGGNANGIADAADGGSIVYGGDAAVSGNITARAGVPATEAGKYLAGGVVAVQAENGDGALSVVELGHGHFMANVTGVGAGLTTGGPLDGGVAGDGGSIKASQTTTGDVSLIANRVVVNPTSGDGASTVHLLHTAFMSNIAGKADIESLLGRGGAIDSTQTTTGTANIRANEISSSPTGAADGLLMADGGPGASHLHIGVNAEVLNSSGSDETIGGKGGADNNRGGAITTTQTVTSAFNLNLDLNGSSNRADLIIRSVGEGAKSVEIGARVTQASRSGHPVDDGSNVTATQTVAGDFLTSGLEDLVVENNGPGSAAVHLGHAVVQTADSGETAGETPQRGGITAATQNVSGAITLQSSRTFTQQTDATATGLNHIGHSGVQTARSADQRVGASAADYPLVAAPGFNVDARQTVQANLSVSSGEILIQTQNGVADGVRLGNTASVVVDTHGGGRVSSNQTLGGNISLTTVAALAQQSSLVTTPVNGDIRVLAPAKSGSAQVGHSSTSKVSHDPAAFQPTGVFVTRQQIVDNVSVTALRNVEVREADGGVARIGHTIVETGALSKTDAVKTSSADPSTVAQSIDSDIAVTAGNSLGMVTDSGTAQIGHYSPPSNEWQVTGGRVVTPQNIGGDVTVKVGLNSTPSVVGEAPAAGALGTNNALLDGTAGGEVRIGHKFAPVTGAALNEVQTASGDIWVEVGAHLHVKTANIGHGPYDFAAATVSKDNAVTGAGATRNRIAGLTTLGAGQNTPSPEDATTEKDLMLFAGANINSGYGENGGELRFFMPSRRNLTIVAGDKIPVTQFNDSTSKTDAIPARSDSTDIVQGAVTHENGFTTMSAAARYVDTGPGNFAFYFGGEDVAPVYIAGPLDYTHRIDRPGGSCIDTRGGGVNVGVASGSRPRNALAWSGPLSSGDDGEGCGAQAPAGRAEAGNAFIPARALTGGAQPGPRAYLPPAAAPIVAGEPGVGETIVIRTAAPAPLSAPVTFGSPDVHAPATPRPIPLQAVRVSGERVLSFSSSGANLVARISPR